MNNGKISVIIPVFRTEEYLEKCIRSVISQTYDRLEIILVDDGSDDNCPDICDRYAEKDGRIVVIHKENGGLSSARNAGLSAATGDYIAFVDSDDYLDGKIYETLVFAMEDSDISICGYYSVKGESVKKQVGFSEKTVLSKNEALKELFRDEKIKNHVWNKLFKKELFDNICFPDGRTFEDILTTYKLFENAKKITYVPYAGYYYADRATAISKQKNSETCFSRYWAHYLRYEDISKRIPEYDEILLRQLFIQARAYMLSLSDEKSEHTMLVTGFFLKNREKLASSEELGFFEKKQAVAISERNISKIKALDIFRKAQKLFEHIFERN